MQPNWFLKLIFGQNVAYWSNFAHAITGYAYYILAHPDPTTWPMEAHRATGWVHFQLPPAEYPSVPKFRDKVTAHTPMSWPGGWENNKVARTDYSKVNYLGNSSGMFIQRGTDQKRSLSWGYAEYGQQSHTEIPLPESGTYYKVGWPTPSWDHHCIVVAPDGAVHEMIQFDPNHPGGTVPPLPNQALGWGVWRDGKIIDGVAVTGYGFPHHAYIWDRYSSEAPHELAIVMANVIGGDGDLPPTGPGPKAGERLVLPRSSTTYISMKAKGGECAALAEAAATYGLRVIDRNHYEKDGTPKPATIHVQVDSSWASTNIGEFELLVTELARVLSDDTYSSGYGADY